MSILCKVALPSLILIRFWGQLHLHRQSGKKISNFQTKLEFDLKEMASVQGEPTKYFPGIPFKVLLHRLIPLENLIFPPKKTFQSPILQELYSLAQSDSIMGVGCRLQQNACRDATLHLYFKQDNGHHSVRIMDTDSIFQA